MKKKEKKLLREKQTNGKFKKASTSSSCKLAKKVTAKTKNTHRCVKLKNYFLFVCAYHRFAYIIVCNNNSENVHIKTLQSPL